MSITEAQKKATKKYKDKAWKRVPLDMPIEEYNNLKQYCDDVNESVSGFIRRIIKEKIK